MRTHIVVFEHFGENSDSAKSPTFKKPEAIDLTEQKVCCLNWDDNRLVDTNRYALMEVTLPNWLSAEEWIGNYIRWTYAWQAHGVSMEWPEAWQRGLLAIDSGFQRYIAAKLLATKNFRSPFRKKLRDHLVTWLETAPDKRQYAAPFSPRQLDALTTRADHLAYKRRETSTYYGDRYHCPANTKRIEALCPA